MGHHSNDVLTIAKQAMFNKFLRLAFAFGACLLGSCQPSDPTRQATQVAVKSTSTVPLRVWIAAKVSEPSIIQRQWQAVSEQPIEIKSISVDELLALETCDCDLLLFPARLMGEMIHRNWIAKLPNMQEQISPESTPVTTSKVALAQTLHNGVPYAISLGCSIPVVISSNALDDKLKALDTVSDKPTWQQLLAELPQEKPEAAHGDMNVDKNALVDRFLAILSTLSERNAKYGLLFEMQTMKSRLTEPEFVAAAEVMFALSQQPGGLAALVGTHEDAWKWVCESTSPAVAIASPVLIGKEAAAMKTGKIVSLQRVSEIRGWNTGGALVAALSASCRQTSRTTAMLQWLEQSDTLAVVAPVIEGVEAKSAVSGTESLGWRVRQQLSETLASDLVSKEPSLPLTERYRSLLADQLWLFLQGQKDAQAALEDASTAWSQVTSELGPEQRTNYEKSLGLTL